MLWKVTVDNCLSSIDEYTVVADNIDEAEKKAVRMAYEYWEDTPMEQFISVSVWIKVK